MGRKTPWPECTEVFTEEEVPDPETRRIMQEGLNTMVGNITELVNMTVNHIVSRRMKQYLLVIREGIHKEKYPDATNTIKAKEKP